MAVRIIREDGDEILRKVSRPVTEFNKNLEILLDDMYETMKNEGVGLAAPQIGILKKIVVIDIGQGVIELINPEIISEEGEQIGAEGCLSIPGVFGEVARPNKVKVECMNRKGENIVIDGEGLLARVLCHEIDHLKGILFKDKAIRFINAEGKNK